MGLLNGHGFVTLATTDLAASVDFYERVCRLVVRERRDGEAFLTANNRHHWLRLVEADHTGLVRLGYQAVDAAAIEEIKDRLTARGIDWVDGGTLKDDGVAGGIRFRDPFGLEIEVYVEMLQVPATPVPADLGFVDLLHAVVFVPDVEAARDFYTETFGMRRSDQIESLVAFLRAENGYHHSLAVARGANVGLDHFAILVRDIDVVMRLRLHALRLKVLGDDVVRHTASGSVSVYLRDDTLDIGVEFCADHEIITDDDYDGRLLRASPATVNAWNVPYPGAAETEVTAISGGTKAGNLASSSAAEP